jgi:hypothetical protein
MKAIAILHFFEAKLAEIFTFWSIFDWCNNTWNFKNIKRTFFNLEMFQDGANLLFGIKNRKFVKFHSFKPCKFSNGLKNSNFQRLETCVERKNYACWFWISLKTQKKSTSCNLWDHDSTFKTSSFPTKLEHYIINVVTIEFLKIWEVTKFWLLFHARFVLAHSQLHHLFFSANKLWMFQKL